MLERKVNTTLEAMTHWNEAARLSPAITKTEAKVVLFTRCHWFSPHSFCLKGEQIRLCKVLKYLGSWFDRKLTFKEYAKQTASTAKRDVASISQFTLSLWVGGSK